MARGKDAKLRRRQNRAAAKDGEDAFGENADGGGQEEQESDIPLPPKMLKAKVVVETVAEDSDEDSDDMPIKSKMKKKRAPVAGAGGGGGVAGTGLKRGPLILLVLLTGTTLLPALIFASDYIGKFMAKSNVLGSVGFRLGIGAVPKKRVLSFYEKHAPEKLDEVPHILSKYYGDYPTLIKRLERKYQDYGYFIGWQEDEAPLVYVREQLQSLYDAWISQYWNRYAPQILKTAFRNIRYNVGTLIKKFKKVWRKHLWPTLEPIFGVPKGTEKQKRQDAAEARKRMYKEKGTRRKNKDFRDDEED